LLWSGGKKTAERSRKPETAEGGGKTPRCATPRECDSIKDDNPTAGQRSFQNMGTMDFWEKSTGPSPKGAIPENGAPADAESERRGLAGEAAEAALRRVEAAFQGEAAMGRAERKGLLERLAAGVERDFHALLSALRAEREDSRAGIGHAPEAAQTLLRSMGGADARAFRFAETEKAAAAARWDWPLARTRIADALETEGDDAENALLVPVCVFEDNPLRPKTVTDCRFCVNAPEDALIPADFRLRAAARFLIGGVLRARLLQGIDAASKAREAGPEDGRSSLAERAARLVEDALAALAPLPDARGLALALDERAEAKNARARGFDKAFGAFLSALAGNGLGFHYVESRENAMDAVVREYRRDEADGPELPDERFAARIRYLDRAALERERAARDAAVEGTVAGLRKLLDLLEIVYRDSKSIFRVNDFDDLLRKNGVRRKNGKWEKGAVGDGPDEPPPATMAEAAKLEERARERLQTVAPFLSDAELRVARERLAALESERAELGRSTDPRATRPGLLVELGISTVKKRGTTTEAAANALGEFLEALPELFRPEETGDEGQGERGGPD